MKRIIRITLLSFCVAALSSTMFTSCQKDSMSYNLYFYYMQDLNESGATITVDGKNYGSIYYIQGAVAPNTSNLNLVKVTPGHHEIRAYDASNKCINSCYMDIHDNSMGCGNSGLDGGGTSAKSDPSGNIFVGLFR